MTHDAPLVPAPIARGSHGAVVAPHHLATAAGLAILRRGGTAVDAAIATNAALAVVVPNACGIGGDAFWLGWDHAERVQWSLNGSGRSSRHVDATGVRAQGHDRMPARGPLTITVPGAVHSWGEAHARFGRLPLADLLAPAIELAADGFPAWDGFIVGVERTARVVEPIVGPDSGFVRVFRPNGRPWRPGERVRLPALAATLARIAEHGPAEFYAGDVAERQAAALAAAGSPIRLGDLREHTSTWTEPIATTYRSVRVTTHPPNSSGIVALQLLRILERFEPPAAAAFGGAGPAESRWLHLGIEAAKLAMADRNRFLTDPAFRDVPVGHLLDEAYAAELAAGIDLGRASTPPPTTVPPGGGTIYLATVDGEGNAVSLIESNWSGFGSGVVDPDTGVHYQNRGAFFSLDPGHANVLEPGKRTLHTLVPGMLFRDGATSPWVVLGSMGGDIQPQIHAQLVSALVDGGVPIHTALAAPRWGVEPEWLLDPPDQVSVEPRFLPRVLDELGAMGHDLVPREPFDSRLGHAHMIELADGGPAAPDGSLAAATDPRSAGLPAVW